MIPLPTNLLRVTVTFNPNNIGNPDPAANPLFTFSGDIVGTTITVPAGLGLIVLDLETVPIPILPAPAPAVFQTTPVQWFRTGADGTSTFEPSLRPGMFMFQRIGDQTVTLLDFNSNQSSEPVDKNHWFHLIVVYNKNTYGSDPSIVNDPPVG